MRELTFLLWATVLVLITGDMTVDAANVRTGEPCSLGIMDANDRLERFLSWLLPPIVILGVSAIVAYATHRQMRFAQSNDRRRMMGILAGISLAVSAIAMAFVSLVFLIDQFRPGWFY